MSLRKIAGLLAAGGLTVGLIGGGVGAQFFDSVTAQEKIQVGTFECKIVAPSDGIIAPNGKSVTYTAPMIMSSAAGSAPFSFTVQNTGSIPDLLTVTTGPVGAPFSIIGAPFDPVPLGAGGTHTYNTGVAWGALTNANLGASGTVTWTVDCGENAPQVVFDNTAAVLSANYPSQPFQAQQTFEWGSQVQLAGTARNLTQAVVTMSTWAPKSQWPAVGTATGWAHPITLNLYNLNSADPTKPGSLIKSVTRTFTMPWRPEADSTCTTQTAWRNPGDGVCYNGMAFNITFDLSGEGIVAPGNVIFGIAYNTQSWGAAPIGTDGPYNSLNVATYPGTDYSGATSVQASVGTFAEPLGVFWNTVTAGNYHDGGVGGVGIFRSDTPGWGTLQPAIQFSAVN